MLIREVCYLYMILGKTDQITEWEILKNNKIQNTANNNNNTINKTKKIVKNKIIFRVQNSKTFTVKNLERKLTD